MAHVYFKPDQEIQALAGTFGGIIYRPTEDGHTSAYIRPRKELPKNATAEQRAEYRRQTTIDDCEIKVQRLMEDGLKAMKQRRAIRMRISRLYDKLNDEKLPEKEVKEKIMEAYKKKRLKNEVEKG